MAAARTVDTVHSRSAPPALEIGLLFLLALLWSGSYIFVKLGVETIPPMTLIAARTVLGGLVLWAAMSLRGLRLPLTPAAWRGFLVQAVLASVLPFLLIAWASQEVPSSMAVILSSTSPIFAYLLARLLPGWQDKPGLRKAAGVALGLAGVALITGIDAFADGEDQLLAQAALIAAGACFGAAALTGSGLAGHDPMVPATGSLLCGSILLLPFALVLDRPWTISPSLESLAAVLGLAVFSTSLAMAIYFRLLRTLGVVGTTAQSYLRVPIGAGMGVLLLGESLPAHAWAGCAAVAVGVMLMTLPERPRPAPAAGQPG